MAENVPHIGPYPIERALARGAMGTVFLALHPKLSIPIAIKILLPEFLQNEKVRQRFEREARAIAALRHPGIVDIYDFGHDPDHGFYLCMEYIDGPHLGEILEHTIRLPESILASIGAELCSALDVAHNRGIIHRDLKPENVFLDQGRVVLGDFGIVKAVDADHPLDAAAGDPQTEVIGTPGFIAPEQLRHEPLEQRTDIFSLSSLLYFMATGKLAYAAKTPYLLEKKFRDTRPESIAELRPDLSHDFISILERCLAVDIQMRPLSAANLRAEFREILDMMGVKDTRDEIAKFQKSPSGYRYHARMRSVNYLTEQLKISVRDNNREEVEKNIQRLENVDPAQHQAYEISGVKEIINQQTPEEAQNHVSPHRIKKSLILKGIAMMVGVFAFWFFLNEHNTNQLVQKKTEHVLISTLTIQASHPTTIFLNGRLSGQSQSEAQFHIASESTELEVVHELYGKIKETIELKERRSLALYIDWPSKTIKYKNKD
ncbi:MAG: serine/threonine-protein kinase [Myxococcota bacterium]|jgi:serine/threonine protein kinase|nr:serine/threonine-protein kinase [Myxococcota bacterium]